MGTTCRTSPTECAQAFSEAVLWLFSRNGGAAARPVPLCEIPPQFSECCTQVAGRGGASQRGKAGHFERPASRQAML